MKGRIGSKGRLLLFKESAIDQPSLKDGHGEPHELAVHPGVVEARTAVQGGDASHLIG